MTKNADLAALINTGSTPVGTTVYLPTTTAPTGYLRCDGSIYNRSAYPSLGTLIGSPMVPSAETFRNSLTTVSQLQYANQIASVNGVAFLGGSAFVNGTTSTANALRTSTDGINWTSRTAVSPGSNVWYSWAYINGTYININSANAGSYTAQTSYWQTSTDLATWTQRSFTSGVAGRCSPLWLVGNPTKGTAVLHMQQYQNDGCGQPQGTGNYYGYYSTNGTSWTACASYPTQGMMPPAAGSTAFVGLINPQASGYSAAVWYSADGSTWSNITSSITALNANFTKYVRVFWNGTYFYLYGSGTVLGVDTNFIARSTNGSSWTLVTGAEYPTTYLSFDNTYSNLLTDSNGYYYIPNYQYNTLTYSPDMVTWKTIGVSGFYGAVCGGTLVGRNTGTSFSQFTITGTGYTPATQFPVPNIGGTVTSTNTLYYYIKT